MKVRYAMLAAKMIVAQETNAVSIIEVMEQLIYQPGLLEGNADPESIPINGQLSFTTLWQTEDEVDRDQIEGSFWVDTPGGPGPSQLIQGIDLKSNVRTRLTLYLGSLPYRGEGTYMANLKIGNTLASWEFELISPPVLPSAEN